MNMRGVSYTKQAEKGIGVIAQEIEKVLPEVVTDGEYKSVAYGNIVGVLIEAIKEQQKQIDKLKEIWLNMALQSSGAISMSEIRSEIGTSGAISMSDLYRVNANMSFQQKKN